MVPLPISHNYWQNNKSSFYKIKRLTGWHEWASKRKMLKMKLDAGKCTPNNFRCECLGANH